MSRDLLDLWSGIKGLQCSIGTDNQGIFSDVWSGLLELENSINGIDLRQLEETTTTTSFKITTINEKLAHNTEHWLALGKAWLPLIKKNEKDIQMLKVHSTTPHHNSTARTKVQEVDFMLQGNVASFPTETTSKVNSDYKIQIENQKTIINSLEHRLEALENKQSSFRI